MILCQKNIEIYHFEIQIECKKKLVIFDSPHYSLNKLNSKKLYLILVDVSTLKLTAQDYLENLFEKSQLSWKIIYFLIFNTFMCTKACIFQQIPYLQTKYFFLNLKSYFSTMFVFLQISIMHLFYDCLIVKSIRNQLKSIFWINLFFPICTPDSDIFDFWDLDVNKHLIFNHLLLILEMHI